MRFLSLFAGIGGFDLGLERAGMKCIGQVENDPYCIKVLEKHWPDVPRWTDIRNFKEPAHADGIDLICGGFPCQPWSGAGKRRGTEDDRDLWPEMLRVIEAVRPRWVIGENVRNFVSMEMGLDRSISDLEAIGGYAVQAFIVPACAVDAPHRRDRCWVVADANRTGRQQRRGAKPARAELPAAERGGDVADASRQCKHRTGTTGKRGGRQHTNGDWRLPEPDLGLLVDGLSTGLAGWPGEPEGVPRVATGVQNRVSKLRALGNSVVPQIPEIIGRAILEAEGK